MARCFIFTIKWPVRSGLIALLQLLLLLKSVNVSLNQCFPIDYENSGPDEDAQPSQHLIVDSDILVSRKPPTDSDRLWPNKTIPFVFHESINRVKKSLIMQAITQWSSETCVHFQNIPRVHTARSRVGRRRVNYSPDYWVTFRADSTGCYSFVGRDATCIHQGQPLSISNGCDTNLVVAHEIGHSIGLFHQHNRPDRDAFVHINWHNLISGSEYYFTKETFDTYDIDYDYTSLMQYNMWHFSRDVMNKSAMVTVEPRHQRLLGLANGISFNDRKAVNYMYSCNETCYNLNATTCLNGGYLRPVLQVTGPSTAVRTTYRDDSDGQVTSLQTSCECDCPPNTKGSHCQFTTDQGYYDSLHPPSQCGNDTISNNGTLVTLINEPAVSCAWTIRPPANHSAHVTFLQFKLSPKLDISLAKANATNALQSVNDESQSSVRSPRIKCALDSLEVRLTDLFDGSFYCDRDITPGTVIKSNSSSLILLLHQFNTYSSESRVNVTLSFTVHFVPEGNDERKFVITTTPSIITSSSSSSSTDTDKVNNNEGNFNLVTIAHSLWSFSLKSFLAFITSLRNRLPSASTASQWG